MSISPFGGLFNYQQGMALDFAGRYSMAEGGRSRVLLTPIGEQVVEIARRILRDSNEIKQITASGGKELALELEKNGYADYAEKAA